MVISVGGARNGVVMLKCFPFSYRALKEEEKKIHVSLSSTGQGGSASDDDSVTETAGTKRCPPVSSISARKSTTAANFTSSGDPIPLPTSIASSDGPGTAAATYKNRWLKQTRHLIEQQQLRKATEPSDSSQRYTCLPIGQQRKVTVLPQSTRHPTTTTQPKVRVPLSLVSSSSVSTSSSSAPSRPRLPTRLSKSKMPRNKGPGPGPTNDWSRNGSFFHKPSRGWLHPNNQVSSGGGGVTYNVRYVGRLDVNASMKSLDFETRSQIAKECINRICEVAGLKTPDKRRKVDKKIARMLGDKPNMDHAGSNVNLRISSAHLKLIVMESDELIANHDMPNVSFASGGDPETLDFVSYVAKDENAERACYVLECGGGLAQDVITTIGQAFELRFKEYLKKVPKSRLAAARVSDSTHVPAPIRPDDPEYYNDLPGKIPPEMMAPSVPPLPDYQADRPCVDRQHNPSNSSNRNDSFDNLIDLSSEPSSPNPLMKTAVVSEYVNDCVSEALRAGGAIRNPIVNDPFDMQPFERNLPSDIDLAAIGTAVESGTNTSFRNLHLQLMQEDWFHGPISRKTAEASLTTDGDFLVRESRGSPGQFVLSGMHNNVKKHLLLVDPEGVVRTKDRKFDSVTHLVDYHRTNRLPIISAESAMTLQTPISKSASLAFTTT